MYKFLTLISASILNLSAFASCNILTTSSHLNDSIATLLNSNEQCPNNVFEFRKLIKDHQLTIETTMVANRGYHNPAEGSFSFFEMVTGKLDSKPINQGELFFGHFTTIDDQNQITADQGPTNEPRLMIEAFAWDNTKKSFNFYELIGDGITNQWFYRGDSTDIEADNRFLHRQPDPSHPQFGNRLRCSGCHGAGGPIMKEIKAPFNDWWEPHRKLDFGGRSFDQSLTDLVDHLVPPNRLADSVIAGLNILKGNHTSSLSLQETLRPLFCPVEVNLMSDDKPNEDKNKTIKIPVEFFINKKLTDNQIQYIAIDREFYEKALVETGSHFPETTLSDADHAWLAPVKATSDQQSIEHLVETGLIDDKFVTDVLSIDMTNPVFSDARCGLLQFVPVTWSKNWKNLLIQQVKLSHNRYAMQLFNQLTKSSHDSKYHQRQGMDFINHCIKQVRNEDQVKRLFLLLLQRRAEIKASEISKNRRGQILEPGFRVIFPETAYQPEPAKFILTESCDLQEKPS